MKAMIMKIKVNLLILTVENSKHKIPKIVLKKMITKFLLLISTSLNSINLIKMTRMMN